MFSAKSKPQYFFLNSSCIEYLMTPEQILKFRAFLVTLRDVAGPHPSSGMFTING